jgi:hypothetical protein
LLTSTGPRSSTRAQATTSGLIFALLWTCPVTAGQLEIASKDGSLAGCLPDSQRLDELESLITAQRARIESLRAELYRVRQRSSEAARREEIRLVVRDLLADADYRAGLYPDVTQVGYDNGFYIKGADEDFLLRIYGFMKVRYTGIERQDDNPRLQGRQRQDDISGFQISDFRIYFMGHIHSPKLTYQMVMEGPTRQANEWRTYLAWINYQSTKELQFTAGLVKLPFGRQDPVNKSGIQFIDLALATEVFKPDRSVGAAIWGDLGTKLMYVVGAFNGVRNHDDVPSLDQLDTDFAYAARLVAHVLGQPIRTESDLAYSKDPQFEVGLSFLYDDNNGDRNPGAFYSIPDRIRAGRGIGGNGMASLVGTDVCEFGADAAFRYRGLSITAEYFLRGIDGDNPRSQWELRTLRHDWTAQQGGYIQCGYFVVAKKIELAARLGGVWASGDDNAWEYAFDVNYFPWGTYNVMLQVDFTRIDEATATSSGGNWSQNDDVNMLRAQLQIRF